MKKELKTNDRGEAQLAMWLPLKIVKDIYDKFGKEVEKAKKDGDMAPKFKQFFYHNYIQKKEKK